MINKTERREHAQVEVTVDLVIFTVRDDQLHVLLIERGQEPFADWPALPGGYVRVGEHLDGAALRELQEETGVDGSRLHLEQFRTYGDPERDPRGRVITVAYLALSPDLPIARAGTDARAADWVPVEAVLDGQIALAFDHVLILREALERARSQLEYTTIAAAFCTEPFTVAELRRVYEVVWGFKLDPSNFRRKVTRAHGFLRPTGEHRSPEIGRPAALYRCGAARLLSPPLLRSSDVADAQFTTPALR
ncbi:NUDIX hydrolase [Actinomadura alba]|uniref:NUDIX hydrolase n=1 Tax=Actinomadura alba TaxID=406431 RepID=A0ABR7LPX9_9ACTN|nr:NUDIX domain-containing protein [Actinomadura alba]MBC6466634.1 NUDIX hydrolase [Actinomadura alba]